MAKISIELPPFLPFTTEIAVRITDINYGGHAGNDSILSLVHESRMQFLLHAGLSELGNAGPGMIMRDVAIEFRKEVFYGDKLLVSVAAGAFGTASFEITYKMERVMTGRSEIVAVARTGMVCYNYLTKKITALTPEMISRLALNEKS